MVYLPTFGLFSCKCRLIYHTWIVWVLSHYYYSPESTTYFGIHLLVQKMSLVPLKLVFQVDFHYHYPLKTSPFPFPLQNVVKKKPFCRLRGLGPLQNGSPRPHWGNWKGDLKTFSWGYDQCFILADASAGVDRADEQTVAMVTQQIW